MITNYESFVNTPNLLDLSEGVQAKLGIKEFSGLFGSSLFESKEDKILLEKAYGTYELGLLYESRKSWFETETPIYMLEGEGHKILFKDTSMFIITNASYGMLNEQFDDAWNWLSNQTSSAIKNVKNNTKAAINAVSVASKETWDALSDGAKKVYEFGKKIVSAVAEFAKANPLQTVAIVLQIFSVLVSFFPPVGLWLSPILLAISGGLEIYEGIHHIKDAYGKLKAIGTDNPKRSAEAFAVGGPLLIAGLIALVFGVNDIITSPTAGSGVGPVASMGGKKAAETWGKTYIGAAVQGFEHFAGNSLGKATAKLGPKLTPGLSKLVNVAAEKGAQNAPTIISILFVTVGKHILGSMWNGVVTGLAGIAKAFSFLLSVPTKIGEAISKFKTSAESPEAKVIASALDSFVGPAMKGMGSFIDNNIKPSVDGASAWLSSMAVNYKDLEKLADSEDFSGEKIEIKNKTIKPKGAVVQKEDSKKIQKLPKVTSGVKEGLNHIQGFEDFSLI
jgi:ElaB/YqjD/DUF883 family membrane-anchored ribosome-binding protein